MHWSLMTDDASEEVEGRPLMGRRVVLVLQSADDIPRSHSNDSDSFEQGVLDRQTTISALLSESLDAERLFSVVVLLAVSVPQEVLSALRMGD